MYGWKGTSLTRCACGAGIADGIILHTGRCIPRTMLYLPIISMQTGDLPRHQLIEKLMAQHTEKVADASIGLWEPMAAQIILIVGEEGFNSLYARSVFLAQPAFPWLAASSLPPHSDQRLAELRKRLEGQTPSQAREANSLLLRTFTDILAALIGEHLTAGILRSAWGNDASCCTGKEFMNG